MVERVKKPTIVLGLVKKSPKKPLPGLERLMDVHMFFTQGKSLMKFCLKKDSKKALSMRS
jgi:hypothetical protein